MPKCESCRSILLAPRPPSRSPPTYDPHSTRCQPVPNFPRLRALALFGRRSPQRVDSLVMPASENLHNSRHATARLLRSLGSVRRAASRNSHSADQVCAEWVRIALPGWPAHGRWLAWQLQPGSCLGERPVGEVKNLQVLIEIVAHIQVLAVRAVRDALRQAA